MGRLAEQSLGGGAEGFLEGRLKGDRLFGEAAWEEAAQAYRETSATLTAVRPGVRGTGPFAPLALAWPCLPDLAWPWPLAFPLLTLGEAREAYLYSQGQLARCLRSLERPEEARQAAQAAKQVRQTSGGLQLQNLNERNFPDTVSLRLTLNATDRQPEWLAWDSARGDLQMLQPDRLTSKLLLIGPGGATGEEFAREFFRTTLSGPAEFTLFSKKAKAGKIDAVTYALWVGFRTGPPLYLPVTVG
jgi:hypothetical protein